MALFLCQMGLAISLLTMGQWVSACLVGLFAGLTLLVSAATEDDEDDDAAE